MTHHHLFALLVSVWSLIPSIVWWFFVDERFFYVSFVQFFIIVILYSNFYSKIRPKSTISLTILITICSILLLQFMFIYMLWWWFYISILNTLLLWFLFFCLLSIVTLWNGTIFHFKKNVHFVRITILALLLTNFINFFLLNKTSVKWDLQQEISIDVATIIDKKTSNIENDRILSHFFSLNEEITYWKLIFKLWELFDWSVDVSQSHTFSYIWQEEVLYPSFLYAVKKRMIWTSLDPNKVVKCWNLFALLWIAQWWDLEYTSEDIITVFRSEAEKNGYLEYWCIDSNTLVTWKMLP